MAALPTIAVVAGTRPEAIKLAPVIAALLKGGLVSVRYIATGQHRDLFDQAVGDGPAPDVDLALMQADQSVARFLAKAALALRDALSTVDPALVIVHGDTCTAYAASLAAYRLGYPIAHVEAGLRTSSIASPFPEELFRRAISRLAALHFAPTGRARDALTREGVTASTVHVTGNTGIDQLFAARGHGMPAAVGAAFKAVGGGRFGLVTIHRRENRGEALKRIAGAVQSVATELGLPVIVPLHPSPNLAPLEAMLRHDPRILPVPPMDHDGIIWLLERAAVVLTDSGGIQEEAVTLGVPVVVLRQETERMEAVEQGRAVVTGSDPALILAATRAALQQGGFPPSVIFGDGRSGPRIARIIEDWLAPLAPTR